MVYNIWYNDLRNNGFYGYNYTFKMITCFQLYGKFLISVK